MGRAIPNADRVISYVSPWSEDAAGPMSAPPRHSMARRSRREHMKRLFAPLVMALVVLCSGAAAQDKWPSRPVTVIVPFAAGGNTDVMARIFAEHLTKRLRQPVLVEKPPGRGGG